MKILNQIKQRTNRLKLGLLVALTIASTANLHAQRQFSSPDDAIKALQKAAATGEKSAMREIFGPQYKETLTGDKVQDETRTKKFAAALAEGCNPVKDGDSKVTLEIGTNNWPMPIPLVLADGQWHFDTAAGKEEIINRHIGKDELHAIGVCRAYVEAQKKFAGMNPNQTGGTRYALKFKSSSGQKDGLYWKASAGEPESPFGPVVAEAHAEGYGHARGMGPHAFHGYYFKILTRQGKDAPGGTMDYEANGNLEKGFALIAWPQRWDQSGIMTFIVNQEGKVYQKNLGEKTPRLANAIKEYNPDSDWTVVEDQGIMDAVSEK